MKLFQKRAGSDPKAHTPYLDLVFSEEGEEEEDAGESNYPYGVRDTSGEIRLVHEAGEDLVQETVQVHGRSYRVRQLDRHLIFRDLYAPPAGDMLFLPNATPATFAETMQRRAPGRCILHTQTHNYYDYDFPFYLCFDTDGAGFALCTNPGYDPKRKLRLLEWERIAFRWDDFPGLKKALVAPVNKLRDACSALFTERINLQLRMPVLAHEDLPCVPATWRGGSEEALRRLTRAICLTEPNLFEPEMPVVVVYRAELEGRRGGLQQIERGDAYDGDHYTGRRAIALCELAFRLNPFTGTDWMDRSSSYHNHRQLQCSALRLKVEIDAPTGHETAEAFALLQDWLADRVHDPEKRSRFDLPPRPKDRPRPSVA